MCHGDLTNVKNLALKGPHLQLFSLKGDVSNSFKFDNQKCG
jgi:hypothetical protein